MRIHGANARRVHQLRPWHGERALQTLGIIIIEGEQMACKSDVWVNASGPLV